MNHHTPRRHRRRRRTTVRTAGILTAVFLALLGPIGMASAHDQLISTDPSSGSTIHAMPGKVSLTYNNIPIAIGSEIRVVDAEGNNWAEGKAKVTDRVVEQAVQAGTPAGGYTVQWRVVSSDGHPIQGTFAFTTESGAPAGAATPAKAADSGGQGAQQGVPGWIVPAGLAVLILIGAGVAIAWRRRAPR